MLEAAFGKDRHLHAGKGGNASADDFAFEGIELVVVPVGELDEGNASGGFNHRGQGIGAEAAEAGPAGGREGSHMAAALPAGVGERMLDRLDAPTLLIQERV